MASKPRGPKQILSRSRLTMRSEILADDGKTPLAVESLGERNLVHILKWLSDVGNIRTQGLQFSILFDGAYCSYTPDISAELWPSDTTHEPIKLIFEEKTKYWFERNEDGQRRIDACRDQIQEQGYRFHLIFRSDIEQIRNNIQRFMVTRMNVPAPAEVDLSRINNRLPDYFGNLTAEFGIQPIMAALGHRKIFLHNLREKLSDKSQLTTAAYTYEKVFN